MRYLTPAAQHGSWVGSLRRGFNRFIAKDMDRAAMRYLEGSEMGCVPLLVSVYVRAHVCVGLVVMLLTRNVSLHALQLRSGAQQPCIPARP